MSAFAAFMMQVPITIIVLGLLIFLAFPIRIDTDEKRRKLNVSRVLTAVIPGLGYIYMGNWIKGIFLMILWVAMVLQAIQSGLRVFQNPYEEANFTASICILLLVWLLGFIGLSGWRKAKKIKKKDTVEEIGI